MSAMEEEGRDWRVSLILTLAVVAVAHSVLVALWLAPSGPVREAAGGSLLTRYVSPYFQQSWDGLEPSLQRVDEALWVRARVRIDDERTAETPWLDVTAAGLTAAGNDIAPARVHTAGRRLAVNLNSAMFELGEDGREVVLGNYVDRSSDQLVADLLAAPSPPAAVRFYRDVDQMITRFASLYTQAHADGRVVQVQYRAGRRSVPAEDTAATLQDVEFTWFDAGWRRVQRGSVAAQAAFDEWVEQERA